MRVRRGGLASLALLTLIAWSPVARAADAPATAAAAAVPDGPEWTKGAQWMSVRAGYAKISAQDAPDGLAGYGFGYARFVMTRWAVGGYIHQELLGRFGHATAIEVPLTIEVVRHTRWGSAMHPYVGVGAGAFYYKYYRTGEDVAGFRPGRYITLGFTSPVAHRNLLGVDIRLASIDKLRDNRVFAGSETNNPTINDAFAQPLSVLGTGFDSGGELHWSVKLNYAFAY
jgi:hypothetical protein